MTLSKEQNTELTDMLTTLQGEVERHNCSITGSALGFVKDQIERHKRFGDGIYMSDKQWKWLRDIHAGVIGDEKPSKQDSGYATRRADHVLDVDTGDDPGYDPDRVSRDMDDEIPF